MRQQPARPNALSLIPFDFFDPKPKQESLQRLAHWVIQFGTDSPGRFRATRELLTHDPAPFVLLKVACEVMAATYQFQGLLLVSHL